MMDVTLDLPLDLKRICQPNAKVYFPKRKEFGVVTRFDNEVHIKLDQGKQSKSEIIPREEFISMLESDEVISKARVILPEDDNKPMRIKPRVKVAEPPQNEVKQTSSGASVTSFNPEAVAASLPKPLLKGYICEKTGKFSTKPAAGLVEIEYRKVTKKVELMLDSVQLQKLKELGII
jgi:hypothetical protein